LLPFEGHRFPLAGDDGVTGHLEYRGAAHPGEEALVVGPEVAIGAVAQQLHVAVDRHRLTVPVVGLASDGDSNVPADSSVERSRNRLWVGERDHKASQLTPQPLGATNASIAWRTDPTVFCT